MLRNDPSDGLAGIENSFNLFAMNRRSFCGAASALAAAGVMPMPRLNAAPGPKESDAIWDLHCHFSGVTGDTVEERTARILQYADRMHIERLVFFMGFPWSYTPEPAVFRKQNDQVLRALDRWPERLLGFAYLNAQYPEECLKEIDRCVVNGPMVGIKLWVARKCSDAEVEPVIRRCGELKAAIYQHTWLKNGGNRPGESTPMDIAALAERNPDVPLICGHTGGEWTRGIRAVRATPNVSVGIGGGEPGSGLVDMAVRELGADRVIYGSDAGGRSFATQLAKVYGAQISDPDKKKILGGNLRRMLSPIMKRKGMRL